MSDDAGRFETGVRSCWGRWPSVPERWSYSSLKDIEACPRRWMLSRAEYPDLWDRRGYPSAPALSALFGDVVHAGLETVVNALVAAGCPSSGSADAVVVLRGLGGYTAVLEDALTRRLSRLTGNPRLSEARLHAYRRTLTDRMQDARVQVQSIVSRTELIEPSHHSMTTSHGETDGDAGTERRAKEVGAHPEAELIADGLRLYGRVDLLMVATKNASITDFKTGEHDPSHQDQLRMYALLWDLDRVANPNRLPTTELIIEYPTHQVRHAAPSADDLRTIEAEIAERTAAAEAEAAVRLPVAKPDPDTCRFCQVRQLCDEYWTSVAPNPTAVRASEWFDFEGVLTAAVGTRGWSATSSAASGPEVLLRTATHEPGLRVGDRVRVLGARRDEDPDSGDIEVAMSVHSELYVVDRH